MTTGSPRPQYASTPAFSPSPDYSAMAYSMPPFYSPSPAQLESLEAAASSRTVYIGNIPPEITPQELLDHVRSGVVESVKILPQKNCAFISFLNATSASHFFSEASLKRLSLNSQDVRIGWGKPSSVPPQVLLAVAQDGASRNVYVGGLPADITEDEILNDLLQYGPIDTIKIMREKNIAFIHFLSISAAIKAVQQLPFEPKWTDRKVFYGRDRCAYISKTQQQSAARYLGIAPGYEHLIANADRDLISSALAQQSAAAVAVAAAAGANNVGNRTVYLGSVHPETTTEEICNVVRGGILHSVKYLAEKHICFVTFVDPTAAAQFYAIANLQGLALHNRRLKIGWGKHSGPLPNTIAMAVTAGASRNIYIGNIDATWPASKLRQDFSEFGEIEQINFLPEKSCAFVNFTHIANAVKALERIQEKEEYADLKVNYGKDRCGNPPRQLPLPFSPVLHGSIQDFKPQQQDSGEGLGIIDGGGQLLMSRLGTQSDADEDESFSDQSAYATHASATSTTLTISEVHDDDDNDTLTPKTTADSSKSSSPRLKRGQPQSADDNSGQDNDQDFVLDDEAAAAMAAAAARTFGLVSVSQKVKAIEAKAVAA